MDVSVDPKDEVVCSCQRDGDVSVWAAPTIGAPHDATEPARILRPADALAGDDDDEDVDVPEPNAVAINWNGTLACCPYARRRRESRAARRGYRAPRGESTWHSPHGRSTRHPAVAPRPCPADDPRGAPRRGPRPARLFG